jgi:UDP-N-acetylmuramate dehydrogenase
LFDGFEHIVRENELLAPFTWFRMGGPAQYFAEPTSLDELAGLVSRCREGGVRIRLLGGGSNLLIRDAGVEGMVIYLSAPAFSQIQWRDQTLTAGGGTKLTHVIATAVREGLAGLEQLVGIPGTVGGALHGNSGTHGGDIGQWTRSATVMTKSGEILTRTREDLRFSYRKSSLDELVILSAEFELERDDPRELTKRMQTLWIIEKAQQPISNERAGFIFKSPGGESAGELIEAAGLKGARVGEAEVSDRNANFIVVNSGATSDDVVRLMDLMQSGVSQRLGIELEPVIDIW